jgi:hypothetical protein
MAKGSRTARRRTWYDSAHASLCLLGSYLRLTGFFRPLEEGVTLQQKVLKYRPVQKLEMLFVSLLAGAKAVCQTGTTLKVDRALQAAFGLPGCAEQSVIADTLDAASEQAVADLRQVVETIFVQHSQARRHDVAREVLVLDLDLSPLPASKRSEGAERCYMGRCRSKTGRKLVRVRAAQYQETVWEDVRPGRTVETLAVVQAAVAGAERLLGLDGDSPEARAKRARVEWRLDSGWGSDEILNWLLGRDYQVTGKFTSNSRVRKLVQGSTAWEPTSSPGREVAAVPAPVELARPTQQYAVRTPSAKKPDGYQHAVVVSSRLELDMLGVIDHYDGRAGMEAELKSDKRGLGLGTLRKGRLAAQQIVVLLTTLAHNVLVWSRRWLARGAPRLASFGIVRLIQEVWAVPGRVKLTDGEIRRVRFRPEHPRAWDVYRGLASLCPPGQTLGFLG